MITVLAGDNSYQISHELQTRVATYIGKYGDMGLERLDGSESSIERMSEAINSLPFLAASKMVILSEPSANKQFIDKHEELLSDVPDSTDLIIVESKLDKRAKYYKFLKKLSGFIDCRQLDEYQLAEWAIDYVGNKQGQLSKSDARFLIGRTGPNQQMLKSELEKLMSYHPNISRQTIELLNEPTPQSSTFDLLEAALAGNRKKTIDLYQDQRSQRVEPIQIIALMTWQLQVVAAVVLGKNKTPEEIAKTTKLSLYPVKKAMSAARGMSRRHLQRLVDDLLALDVRMKSEAIDADDALQHYLLTMKNPA